MFRESLNKLKTKYPNLEFGASGFADRPTKNITQIDDLCFVSGVELTEQYGEEKLGNLVKLTKERRRYWNSRPEEDPLSGIPFIAGQKFGPYDESGDELRLLVILTDASPHFSPKWDNNSQAGDLPVPRSPSEYVTCDSRYKWLTIPEIFDPLKDARAYPVVVLYPKNDAVKVWTDILTSADYDLSHMTKLSSDYDPLEFTKFLEDTIDAYQCKEPPTEPPTTTTAEATTTEATTTVPTTTEAIITTTEATTIPTTTEVTTTVPTTTEVTTTVPTGVDCTKRDIKLWLHLDLTSSFRDFLSQSPAMFRASLNKLKAKYPNLDFGASGFADRPTKNITQIDDLCFVSGVELTEQYGEEKLGNLAKLTKERRNYWNSRPEEDPLSGIPFIAGQKFGPYDESGDELRLLVILTDASPHFSPKWDNNSQAGDLPVPRSPSEYVTCDSRYKWLTIPEIFDPLKTARAYPVVVLYPQNDAVKVWTDILTSADYDLSHMTKLSSDYDPLEFTKFLEDTIDAYQCKEPPTEPPTTTTAEATTTEATTTVPTTTEAIIITTETTTVPTTTEEVTTTTEAITTTTEAIITTTETTTVPTTTEAITTTTEAVTTTTEAITTTTEAITTTTEAVTKTTEAITTATEAIITTTEAVTSVPTTTEETTAIATTTEATTTVPTTTEVTITVPTTTEETTTESLTTATVSTVASTPRTITATAAKLTKNTARVIPVPTSATIPVTLLTSTTTTSESTPTTVETTTTIQSSEVSTTTAQAECHRCRHHHYHRYHKHHYCHHCEDVCEECLL